MIMKNLIPFEKSEKALAILNDGKALSTYFIFDDNGPYKEYKEYYYKLVGFDQNEDPDELHLATIIAEIGNMPEHYVVVGAKGKIVSGLHGDMFYIDTEELEPEL